jgi:hypothetical protein
MEAMQRSIVALLLLAGVAHAIPNGFEQEIMLAPQAAHSVLMQVRPHVDRAYFLKQISFLKNRTHKAAS